MSGVNGTTRLSRPQFVSLNSREARRLPFPSPFEQRETAEDNRTLLELLDTPNLSARERRVIKHRFGIDGPEQTLEQIATRMAITRERVRQIEARALSILRGARDKTRKRRARPAAGWRSYITKAQRDRALRLRSRGLTYEEIATKMGRSLATIFKLCNNLSNSPLLRTPLSVIYSDDKP